ncbi:hypothetical protein K505DRAFT_64989 [Melanomma pulvis-pyrius CBS 109.77]|uniref:Uncharacterized protein n=1 Tax=Melanomma pulvis-pyrius CBS 109.77 TaxID=1314802 RepID=A0A6A6X5J9_9PLEO|nr:hypothetical protein K505DRAFT_64989 [Melanomma pulvis-pyrius CBS 109.77]
MHIGSFSTRPTFHHRLHSGPSRRSLMLGLSPFRAHYFFYGSCIHTYIAACCHVLSTFRFALCTYTFFFHLYRGRHFYPQVGLTLPRQSTQSDRSTARPCFSLPFSAQRVFLLSDT